VFISPDFVNCSKEEKNPIRDVTSGERRYTQKLLKDLPVMQVIIRNLHSPVKISLSWIEEEKNISPKKLCGSGCYEASISLKE
jgi:hypothetical protein